MSKSTPKLKQRAVLISILNKYRNIVKIDNAELKKDIDTISQFEDKTFIFKTLLAEITSSKGVYCDVCSIITLEAIDDKLFEEISINFLQDKKISDEKKFLIISLMKQKGLDFNYRDIVEYVDNAEELAHSGVENFLKNALFDPDVQLDLLDFFVNIPKEEKQNFLENLVDEFCGDDLANAFSILIQLNLEEDEFDFIFNILLNSQSPYALIGLEYVLENKKIDIKTKTKLKKIISKIIDKNPDFNNNYLVKDSKIHKAYISFVDGKSDFSLVFSRIRKDETIDTLLCTINLTKGITSCMGFCLLPKENFEAILKRLFSDSMPVEITPVAFKSLYEHYMLKSKKNNIVLPYELIVWKNILNDVRAINYDISEFINSKLEVAKLTKAKVLKFVTAKIVETWYYSYGDNKFVDEVIDRIEKEHCLDLDVINSWVDELIEKNFILNKEYMAELQSRLLLQAYVASLAKLKMTSAYAYSLCFKNPYTKMLIQSMIDKSIYYALSTKLYQLDEENIFKKEPPTKFSKDELEILMAQLEEKWT